MSLKAIAPRRRGDSRPARLFQLPTASATRPPTPCRMNDGEVLLLENTRFHKGEEKNDPGLRDGARRQWRHLCQRRLLRAIAPTPRPKACSSPSRPMPAAPCRRARSAEKGTRHPKRPVVCDSRRAKVSTKIDLLQNLVKKVTRSSSGRMANTFLAAQGVDVGNRSASTILRRPPRPSSRRLGRRMRNRSSGRRRRCP